MFPNRIIAAEIPDEKQGDTRAALWASHIHFLARSAAAMTTITLSDESPRIAFAMTQSLVGARAKLCAKWGDNLSMRAFLGCVLLLTGLLLSDQVRAVTVQYDSTELPDLVAGQDFWSHHYENCGIFGAFEGVNLLYSADVSASAHSPHR